jgi:hypothetical protein
MARYGLQRFVHFKCAEKNFVSTTAIIGSKNRRSTDATDEDRRAHPRGDAGDWSRLMPTVKEMTLCEFGYMVARLSYELFSQLSFPVSNSDLLIQVPELPVPLHGQSLNDKLKCCGIEIKVCPGMPDNQILLRFKKDVVMPAIGGKDENGN